MQQAFYTSVSNANIHDKGKGCRFKSDPIPLLKENFLDEFRSNLEKAKVRKNLGIPDEVNLRWENIQGNIDAAPTLLEYINKVWGYTTPLYADVTDVKGALDKMLTFINEFSSESEAVAKLQSDLSELSVNLNKLTENESDDASAIIEINTKIANINNLLSNITGLISISDEEDNALTYKVETDEEGNETAKGLYVPDLSNRIQTLEDKVYTYNTELEETLTSPYTVGGIKVGTSVKTLKDKSVTELLDLMLFPTVTRSLVRPTYTAKTSTRLVKIGTTPEPLEFTFSKGDAGDETGRELSPELPETYTGPSTTTYTSTVSYGAGEYLVDNKGDITTSRVEAGTLSASTTITTTYPWYINNTEQTLVPFDKSTTVKIDLLGNPVIKFPGLNSSMSSFKVLGLGNSYLPVNMSGWTMGTELINGITYVTWTKNESYNSILNHELTFTLKS